MRTLVEFSLTLLMVATLSSKAWAEIIPCNEKKETIEYAIVWDDDTPIIAQVWKTAGWYRLKPGTCMTILQNSGRQELYLSVRQVTPKGPILSVYPLTERQSYTKGMYGIEDIFCVKRDSQVFQRTAKRLEELRQCPDGWLGQTYNILGFTTAGTSLRMTLGE
jgi:hypothetical protein